MSGLEFKTVMWLKVSNRNGKEREAERLETKVKTTKCGSLDISLRLGRGLS